MASVLSRVVTIDYTNHKGARALRRIVPHSIEFVNTEWHLEEQWIIHAFDLDKDAMRSFAMRDIQSWSPISVHMRQLSVDEYEAKVAAGKKIKFADGGEH